MEINERMAALAQTPEFQQVIVRAAAEGPLELSEEDTMLLAGILCVDCRVRLVVAVQPPLVSVEVLHDTACPTWLAVLRARRAEEN